MDSTLNVNNCWEYYTHKDSGIYKIRTRVNPYDNKAMFVKHSGKFACMLLSIFY
ncbi:MAG: hypothetical protein K0R09_2617 [Clostridiales bacterium]|jgi:hypothetical protein|nr:hypothetical protein [Clostridiales bacterium]